MCSIAVRNGAPAGQTAAGGLGGEAAGFGEAETPCGRQPDSLHGSGKTKKKSPALSQSLSQTKTILSVGLFTDRKSL